MGICWYCHWGWPKQVSDIYDKFASLVSDPMSVLQYGPGHIVWADENFETEDIQWCIDNADKWRKHDWDAQWPEGMRHTGLLLSDGDFNLAVESLRELISVPEAIRCCEPSDYDDEHPESFPPPVHLEMIAKH